jgi:soluble lytic murein transglycosylase
LPDEGLIRKWCKKYRLDPLLVAALIRQESAFNEQAVSNVGAVGLMQLMPATAGRLAGERRQRFRPVRLTNPDYNIDYGCYYLAQLMKMFKESSGSQRLQGGVELALAAYNAGEEAVQRWLETRPAEDVQTFVENIPYTQTREYVQIILRNHKIYWEIYPRR